MLLTIRPHTGERQQVLAENLKVDPPLEPECFQDLFENRMIRLRSPGGLVRIQYEATVFLDATAPDTLLPEQHDPGDLVPEVLPFLFPSRYCQSDRLGRFACSLVDQESTGYARVNALCDWIYENIEYQYGTTDEHTSATDMIIQRVGVCRDFAHLGIALCRAIGIPARFVAGYADKLDPPDFHAYFEAYLSNRWYLFDATRKVPREGLVRIATGRDAADTSFANLFGPVAMEQMQVWSRCVEGDPTMGPGSDATPMPARVG